MGLLLLTKFYSLDTMFVTINPRKFAVFIAALQLATAEMVNLRVINNNMIEEFHVGANAPERVPQGQSLLFRHFELESLVREDNSVIVKHGSDKFIVIPEYDDVTRVEGTGFVRLFDKENIVATFQAVMRDDFAKDIKERLEELKRGNDVPQPQPLRREHSAPVGFGEPEHSELADLPPLSEEEQIKALRKR